MVEGERLQTIIEVAQEIEDEREIDERKIEDEREERSGEKLAAVSRASIHEAVTAHHSGNRTVVEETDDEEVVYATDESEVSAPDTEQEEWDYGVWKSERLEEEMSSVMECDEVLETASC